MFARLLLLAMLAFAGQAGAQALPVFSDTGPDAAAYGAAEGYKVGSLGTLRAQRYLVGAYSHYDQLRPAHPIAASPRPSELRRAAQEIQVTYEFQGQRHTLDDYLARNPATGLLILRDRTIEFEHYQYARRDSDRFTSQSMAKTILGLLVGIAVQDGTIHSIDDTVATYVPELAGTEAGHTKLRALLHMASGIDFHEVYDGRDDIMRLSHDLMQPDSPGAVAAVSQFNTRVAAPDTAFHYAGLNSELLGLVLARTTGKSLADLAEREIWAPIGAEAAASWVVDRNGLEVAYCCFNAVLRDWGRLGAMLAQDGEWDGTQLVPRQWLLDATTPQAPFLAPGAGRRLLGYGYQVWLLPGTGRQFALLGIYGQTMLIDPASRTVLVHTAVRPKATDRDGQQELFALWAAVVASEAPQGG
jgi:CubicO group peptidase (beta-lactamase class C family)